MSSSVTNSKPTPQQLVTDLREKLGIGVDKTHAVMGSFHEPDELVAAGRKIHEMGYRKLDAMSPFPVHGIDAAIGIHHSKIGWMVVCFAMLGLATAQFLQYYVGVINYPLVIGGKPLFDFTFSIPVTFELTVLFSAISCTVGMYAINGLPRLYHPTMRYSQFGRVTDDKFVLVIEADDPMFDAEKTVEHLKSVGAHDVEVVQG